jgi:4-hydroxy-tetrahydrodipicolinate synthase
MNPNRLKGIFPIIYCFFNKNNTLDKKLILEEIELIKKIGSNGIASLGLATEVNKLSFNEKKFIIELVAENCVGSIPAAVTIQGSSLHEYIKLIDVAKNNQADWIILQPLIKKNTTDKDCYNFFKKLIPYAGDTIVGIQNAKEYLGVGLKSKDIIKLYKTYDNFRAIKGESSAALIQSEISKYPKDLRVFNGRGGQEIIDNFIVGCRGIVPALENADNFIKIYKYIQNKKFDNAHKEYMKILPSIVFIMQSINSLVCYGKRICAYRMGVKIIYDRSPGMIPTSFGLRKSKEIAKNLGLF